MRADLRRIRGEKEEKQGCKGGKAGRRGRKMMRWRGKTGNAKRKYWVVGQTKGTKVRSLGARHH